MSKRSTTNVPFQTTTRQAAKRHKGENTRPVPTANTSTATASRAGRSGATTEHNDRGSRERSRSPGNRSLPFRTREPPPKRRNLALGASDEALPDQHSQASHTHRNPALGTYDQTPTRPDILLSNSRQSYKPELLNSDAEREVPAAGQTPQRVKEEETYLVDQVPDVRPQAKRRTQSSFRTETDSASKKQIRKHVNERETAVVPSHIRERRRIMIPEDSEETIKDESAEDMTDESGETCDDEDEGTIKIERG